MPKHTNNSTASGNDALNQELKSRIQLEEVYRAEVRKELSEPKTRFEHFIAFLNSALGLWFLSSVVLGAITYGYSAHQESAIQASRNANQATIINIELNSRISFFKHYVQKINMNDEAGGVASYDAQTLLNAIDAHASSLHLKGVPLSANAYREFEGRTITSLLLELFHIDPLRKAKVKQAFAANLALREAWLKMDDKTSVGRDFLNRPELQQFLDAMLPWSVPNLTN